MVACAQPNNGDFHVLPYLIGQQIDREAILRQYHRALIHTRSSKPSGKKKKGSRATT
jgi:hypothetical protein